MSTPRLIKTAISIREVRAELLRCMIAGEPHAVLDQIMQTRQNGQLIYHLGTGGGIGQIEWREEKRLEGVDKPG